MKRVKLTACALMITGMIQVAPETHTSDSLYSGCYNCLPQETYQQVLVLATLAALGTGWYNRAALKDYFTRKAALAGAQTAINTADEKTKAKQAILKQLLDDLDNPNKNNAEAFTNALNKYQELRDKHTLTRQDYIDLFKEAKGKLTLNIVQYGRIMAQLAKTLLKMDGNDKAALLKAFRDHFSSKK